MRVEFHCTIIGGPYDGGSLDFKSHDGTEAEYERAVKDMAFVELDGHQYRLEKIDLEKKTAEAVW